MARCVLYSRRNPDLAASPDQCYVPEWPGRAGISRDSTGSLLLNRLSRHFIRRSGPGCWLESGLYNAGGLFRNVRRWEIFNSTRPILWSQFQQNAANTGRVLSPQILTITKTGAGTGTVTSSPFGITCGASCAALFNSGDLVTLTAAADAGSIFSGWAGDCSGWGICQVTMAQARTSRRGSRPCQQRFSSLAPATASMRPVV